MFSSKILTSPLIFATLATSACPPVHLFGARGTNEKPGYGFLAGGFVNETLKAIPGATAEPIIYPANGSFDPVDDVYRASVRTGVSNLTKQITAFSQNCPETPLVLIGYSQGAKIFDDALCGGGDPFDGINSTEPTIAQFNIKAVLLPGDDRFTVGEPFHVGNATHGGLDPRPSSQLRCGNFTDAIQLYCNANDEWCANGTSLAVHLSYYPQYAKMGLEFIKMRLGMNGTNETSTSPSSTGQAMPTYSSAAQRRIEGLSGVASWVSGFLFVAYSAMFLVV